MGSQRVGHDSATFTTKTILPGESPEQRTLVGCSPWVAKNQTWLKWLRMHGNIDRNPSGLNISQTIAMKWKGKSALEDLIGWHFEEKNISAKEDDLCRKCWPLKKYFATFVFSSQSGRTPTMTDTFGRLGTVWTIFQASPKDFFFFFLIQTGQSLGEQPNGKT